MAAISDVARLAGVSKATASRALSGRGHVAPATRHRVEQAAAEIGYIASPDAASLVTGRTMNVGVVIPYVNRWFFGEVLEGVETALLAAGYDLTLYHLGEPGPERRRVFDFFLARKRVDAVLAVGIDLAPHEVESLDRREKPIVLLGGSGAGAARLSIDDRAIGQLATEHLLHLGHTRIAHLAGLGAAAHGHSVPGLRRRGFLEAMSAAGLTPAGRAHIVEAEMSLPGGYVSGLQLLGHPGRRPTAVFAASDEVAFGLMRAADRLGISIPGELSVIGVDGHEYADLFGLTTVEQHPAEQGALAVEVLLRLLGEGDAVDPLPDSGAPLPTRLVVRSSTTSAPR
ncbi:LacI family DNA-binding transcriptional regulator [Agromyces sp. CFH 90414]|uniref:LacI family DNA-binding transcriptional regulator n=1 Tax=Agromyces agglutinans TaxID=2662258 RepID=A0A6I2FC23_9MICO|nr:LacI family DNA-binding transcriptional regulator [Agromyces agglutinans]MRG61674.1 LacI family DNA-binding transcriptional regulator [Agromyces agglutinans]